MSEVWRSVRSAFKSWWAVLGLLAASVSGFNLLRNALQIDLSIMLQGVFSTYQQFVHRPIAWLAAFFHLELPSWVIDAAIIWFLCGGIVFRSAQALMGRGKRLYWSFLFRQARSVEYGSLAPLLVFLSVVAWPVAVIYFLAQPRLFRDRDGQTILTNWPMWAESDNHPFVCDMRIVLLAQALTAALVVFTWAVLNTLTAQYG